MRLGPASETDLPSGLRDARQESALQQNAQTIQTLQHADA